MSCSVQLRSYDNSWYNPGRSNAWRAAWIFLGLPIFRSPLFPSSALRVAILRLFGAKVGKRVVIHSEVVVKYPWHLVIGDDCWIGECSWLDNLTTISLANNVCISQGAYLCTGNHDWSDSAFGLRVDSIHLGEGAWAGAMCRILPGVILHEGAIAAAGSVVTVTIPPYQIFSGNPAVFVRDRSIRRHQIHPVALEVQVL